MNTMGCIRNFPNTPRRLQAAFVAAALCAALTACGGGGRRYTGNGCRSTRRIARNAAPRTRNAGSGTRNVSPCSCAGVGVQPDPACAADHRRRRRAVSRAIELRPHQRVDHRSDAEGPGARARGAIRQADERIRDLLRYRRRSQPRLPERLAGYLLSRQLHRVPAASEVFPERAECFRSVATARRVRAIADSRHLRDRAGDDARHRLLPADVDELRVRQFPRHPAGGDAFAGDGRVPRHGQQSASPIRPAASSRTKTTRASCCSCFRSANGS